VRGLPLANTVDVKDDPREAGALRLGGFASDDAACLGEGNAGGISDRKEDSHAKPQRPQEFERLLAGLRSKTSLLSALPPVN
jgi:hypothetical protein